MKTNENIHSGHRQRLRQHIDTVGLYGLSDLHFLENLLTYTIPRADTNPIAHNLLNEFKSIDAIFEANIDALMSVKGIGEKTARFLNYMSTVIYMNNKSKALQKPFVGNLSSTLTYIYSVLPPTKNEQFIILIVSKNYEVKNYKIFEGITHSAVDFDFQIFLDYLIKHKSSYCIIAHTHPEHPSTPSYADISMFDIIKHNLKMMKIGLIDNLIIGEKDIYSEKM